MKDIEMLKHKVIIISETKVEKHDYDSLASNIAYEQLRQTADLANIKEKFAQIENFIDKYLPVSL